MILKLLGALIRLLLLMATLITVAAIGIGNADRESLPRHVVSPSSYQVLDRANTAIHGDGALIVHLESGRLESLPLPPGVGIDKGSVSPWEENWRRQIVAVGWKRSGVGAPVEDFPITLVGLGKREPPYRSG